MSKYSIISGFGLSLMVTALLASQAAAPAGQWEHLFEGSRILAGKDGAWIVQEPRVVSNGFVENLIAGPGPDQAVLLVRKREVLKVEAALDPKTPADREGAGRLQIVNLLSGSAREVNLPTEFLPVNSMDWLNEGRLLIVFYGRPENYSAALVDLVGGGILPIEDFFSLDFVESEIPAMTLIYTVDKSDPDRKEILKLVDFSSGAPRTRVVPVPARMGPPIRITKNLTVVAPNGKNGLMEVNLGTGAIRDWTANESSTFLNIQRDKPESQSLSTVIQKDPKPGLYLSTTPGLRSELRLSKEADQAVITAQDKRVLFKAHGVAFVCDLMPVNLDAAVKSLTAKAIERAKVIAKQNGTAAMIYAADYDDALPFSGASANDALEPYLKNRSLQQHVVWSNLYGQKISQLTDPSKVELGYVPGPGGRAIIYADSRVEWRPTPP